MTLGAKERKEETKMKKLLNSMTAITLAALIGMVNPGSVLAVDFVTKQHGVTVQVPEILSIAADTTNFTLTYAGYIKTNDESSTKTVTYTVQSNNMRQADGATAVNANLDALYDRLDFLADVGTYTKTSGNTEIAEAASGFVKVEATNTAIAKKANTVSGSDGKLLNGTIPVTYKAKATGDVPAGDQIRQLFVTLTTI